MTEDAPRINGCPHAASSVSTVESDVGVNVTRVRAPNVNTAEIPNGPNQYRSGFVRRSSGKGHTLAIRWSAVYE